MATIDFQQLSLLITLFAAALTSSVNAGPDGISSASPIPVLDLLPKSSPIVEHSSDGVGDKKASKLWYTSRMAEGGPLAISTTTQLANIESVADELNKFDESRARENVPKERNNNPSVVTRKEKIKPRKGVDQNMDPQMTNISFNQTTLENTKPVMETASAETAHVNNQSETSTGNILEINITNSHVNNNLDHITNSNYSNTSLISTNITKFHTEAVNHTTTPMASSPITKHIPKPKPTVTTVDGPEPSESRLSSRTKNLSLGMPRKIDYIVPVIITIIALPILGAVLFVLYRRGRDCWDKRHYRRMDFLIDGMYND
ncbi:uncharacterized protein [Anoplolepis gracilipes]|uniref:uncharacterized protein n=1 Tax=Anoplolepis gracilipes TaxID=354296 RepID=UPI003BA0A49E